MIIFMIVLTVLIAANSFAAYKFGYWSGVKKMSDIENIKDPIERAKERLKLII